MTTSPTSAVRRLALARVISLSGGAAAYTALMFTIYQRTHSAAWMAAAALATFGAEGLLGPLGGLLGDRLDRKKVMIASELVGAAFFCGMALAEDPGWLVLLSLGSAVVEPPFASASAAAIPNLVGPERIAWANSTVTLGRNLGILLGPVLGGVLVSSVGAGAVFAANAASFLVSAAIIATVTGRFADPARERSHGLGLGPGFRFLWQERVLRTITLAWLVLILGFGMAIVSDVPLVESFGAGSVGFGILIAFWGAGTAAGSIVGRVLTARTELRAVVLGMLCTSLMGLAIWFSPAFWFVLVATAVMGVGDSLAEVGSRGQQQRRTPDELRSRVSAASDGIVNTGFAVSFVLGGVALDALGPKPVYGIGGITAGLGVLVMLTVLRARPVGEEALAAEPSGVADAPLVAARSPLPGQAERPAREPRPD